MGALCARSDGQEDTTVFKRTVGKDYEEMKDKYVGEGVKRTHAWKSHINRLQLQQKREEFWGSRAEGRRHIWVVLKQATEADPSTARMLLEATEISMENDNLTVNFDRHGQRYEIPIFVINDPVSFAEGKMAPRQRKPLENVEIKIKIRCFKVSDKDIDITIENSKTILELKNVYSSKLDDTKPVESMRVFFGGKELKDDETLIQNRVRKNNVVQILVK